jgi:hypothetical protein
MHLQIRNLGNIQQADIDIKDLTIICGPNGSNKTWLSYAIFHYFHIPNSGIAQVRPELAGLSLDDDEITIDISSDGFTKLLVSSFATHELLSANEVHKTFNASKETFKDFRISQDDVNENRLSHQKAREMVDCLIEETVNYAEDQLSVSSGATDKLLSLEFKVNSEHNKASTDKKLFLFSVFINDMIKAHSSFFRPFALTSERVGCLAFQKDIDGSSLKIKNKLESLLETYNYDENEETLALIREMYSLSLGNRASVPVPVRKNLDAVRNAQEILTKQSDLKTQSPELIEALGEITKGSFTVNNGVLSYQYDNDNSLPITIASSSIKSLYHLDLYINNLAKKNDILLIDEPELNLHPDNQRKMAKVIARLVNAGVKVLLTTHSDYLVRELNNSIMLSSEFQDKSKIMETHQLIEADILTPAQVSAYAVDTQGEFSAMTVDKLGVNTQIFDSIIKDANQLQSEIYYSLEEMDE